MGCGLVFRSLADLSLDVLSFLSNASLYWKRPRESLSFLPAFLKHLNHLQPSPPLLLGWQVWGPIGFHTVKLGQAVPIPCVLSTEKDAEEKGLYTNPSPGFNVTRRSPGLFEAWKVESSAQGGIRQQMSIPLPCLLPASFFLGVPDSSSPPQRERPVASLAPRFFSGDWINFNIVVAL